MTSRHQSRFLVAIGVALALSACSADHVAYEVPGAAGRFCVPSRLNIAAPYWLADIPTLKDGGFAVACPSKAESACAIPDQVISAGVGPLAEKPPALWENWHADAFYRRIVSEPGTTLVPTDDGLFVVVANASLSDLWLVWSKSSNSTSVAPGPGDALWATCKESQFWISGKGPRRGISCDRWASGSDFAFHYSFESQDRVPKGLPSLDTQVSNVIEGWRCENGATETR